LSIGLGGGCVGNAAGMETAEQKGAILGDLVGARVDF